VQVNYNCGLRIYRKGAKDAKKTIGVQTASRNQNHEPHEPHEKNQSAGNEFTVKAEGAKGNSTRMNTDSKPDGHGFSPDGPGTSRSIAGNRPDSRTQFSWIDPCESVGQSVFIRVEFFFVSFVPLW
jgi:hypothetical protein